MTIKIAVLSGRPADGTLLPKQEKYVWQELKRVLKNDLSVYEGKDVEFLIPIYNKFDLEVLRICEQLKLKVTYYVPTPEWGTERLPKHQLDLIRRMRNDVLVVPGRYDNRLRRMIQDSDIVYVLAKTQGVEDFAEELVQKAFYLFPEQEMLYTTEEDANRVIQESLSQNGPNKEEIDAFFSKLKVENMLN